MPCVPVVRCHERLFITRPVIRARRVLLCTGRVRARITLVTVLAVGVAACTPLASLPGSNGATPTTATPSTGAPGPCAAGPIAARAIAKLDDFTGWLEREHVAGVIGEVGWPGSGPDLSAWNAVGSRWFQAADAANVGALVWATGEWWQTGYRLSPYVAPSDGDPVSQTRSNAAVLEAHLSVGGVTGPTTWRGVTVAGGEFGGPGPLSSPTSFSNANNGVYDTNYHFDQAATFTYLASRGIPVVRIPFRWEVVQPVPFQPLDAVEVARVRAAAQRASAAGIGVLLDVHNYGAYWLDQSGQGVRRALGSPELPTSALADLWGRLAASFTAEPGVLGYWLMNEPIGLPGATERTQATVWEQASQAAVTAIRAHDTHTTILVGGYGWSGADGWSVRHPHAWITDPNDSLRYEAHEYFDEDGSGSYTQSYATEVAHASAWQTTPC